MSNAKKTTRAVLLVVGALGASTAGCIDPRCPRGYTKKGDTCYRIKDAGVLDADAESEGDADPVDSTAEPERDGDIADAVATMPDDETDACEPNPCEHEGRCSLTPRQDISCDCAGTGYEGSTCQLDIDECSMLNACSSSTYPCVQTAPPGYTCKGQLADWPMPDALAGAKFAPAYDISTTGVVRDTITGLTWQRGVGENANGYTWIAAKVYCDALELAGQTDWRLPTKIELESIVDETRRPAIDNLVFSGTPDDILWSASPVAGEPDARWLLDFLDGSSAYFIDVSSPLAVRCVRGPAEKRWAEISSPRYVTDVENDTVTDARTGLVWQRVLSTGNHTWEGAMTYCVERGEGWRLPAYKELLTLADPSRSNPSIDPTFPGTPAVSFWSASPSLRTDGTPDWPRRVDFVTGASDFFLSMAPNRVRCVR